MTDMSEMRGRESEMSGLFDASQLVNFEQFVRFVRSVTEMSELDHSEWLARLEWIVGDIPLWGGNYHNAPDAGNVACIAYDGYVRCGMDCAIVQDEHRLCYLVLFATETPGKYGIVRFAYYGENGGNALLATDSAIGEVSAPPSEMTEMSLFDADLYRNVRECPARCGTHHSGPSLESARLGRFTCSERNVTFFADVTIDDIPEECDVCGNQGICEDCDVSDFLSDLDWCAEDAYECRIHGFRAALPRFVTRAAIRPFWHGSDYLAVFDRDETLLSGPYTTSVMALLAKSEWVRCSLTDSWIAHAMTQRILYGGFIPMDSVCVECSNNHTLSRMYRRVSETHQIHGSWVVDPYDQGWARCGNCQEWHVTDEMYWSDRFDEYYCESCHSRGHGRSSDSYDDDYFDEYVPSCAECGATGVTFRRHLLTEKYYCEGCAAIHVVSADSHGLPEPSALLRAMPYVGTWGIEYEVGSNGQSLAERYSTRFGNISTEKCGYHCSCSDCADNDFAYQSDCTVDSEFPSHMFHFENDGDFVTISQFLSAASEVGVRFDKVCSGDNEGSDSVGAHVNIGKNVRYVGDDPMCHALSRFEDDAANQAYGEIRSTWFLMRFASEMNHLSAGSRSLRGYNGMFVSPQKSDYNPDVTDLTEILVRSEKSVSSEWSEEKNVWRFEEDGRFVPNRNLLLARSIAQRSSSNSPIADKGNRYEFRLWNGTGVMWRSRLSVAISAAVVLFGRSALNVADVAEMSFEDLIGRFLSVADRKSLSVAMSGFGEG